MITEGYHMSDALDVCFDMMSRKSINPALRRLKKNEVQSLAEAAQLARIRTKSIVLGIIASFSAILYWSLLRKFIVADTIQYGLGWPIFVAPFAVWGLHNLLYRKPALSPIISCLYAVFIGIIFGGYAGVVGRRYPDVVIHTVITTFGTYLGLLIVYRVKLIKVDSRFAQTALALMTAIVICLFFDGLMSFLFMGTWRSYFSLSALGLALNVCMLLLGAMALLLDFDFVGDCVREKASREVEWQASAGLLTSVLWLFLAILFLLGRARK